MNTPFYYESSEGEDMRQSGWYWRDEVNGEMIGPFLTEALAYNDMRFCLECLY